MQRDEVKPLIVAIETGERLTQIGNRCLAGVTIAVDPQAWLTQTLKRLANGRPSSEIDALMPWSYKA